MVVRIGRGAADLYDAQQEPDKPENQKKRASEFIIIADKKKYTLANYIGNHDFDFMTNTLRVLSMILQF